MHGPHHDPEIRPPRWDRVIVINLPDRPDRLEAFRRTVRQSKILSGVTIERHAGFTPAEMPCPTWWAAWKPTHYACRAAHLDVWRGAIRDRVRNLLVFEDDARIYANFDARLTAFAANLPADWWGYQLGGFTWRGHGSMPAAPGVLRMGGIGGLHCYGLNAPGIRRAYDHVLWHNQVALDAATAQLYREEPHFYMPARFFVSQAAGYSDNEGRDVDYGAEYMPEGGYDSL